MTAEFFQNVKSEFLLVQFIHWNRKHFLSTFSVYCCTEMKKFHILISKFSTIVLRWTAIGKKNRWPRNSSRILYWNSYHLHFPLTVAQKWRSSTSWSRSFLPLFYDGQQKKEKEKNKKRMKKKSVWWRAFLHLSLSITHS